MYSMYDYTKIRVKNHVVGIVMGDTFVKKVIASQHFLEKPPAICFDVSSLDDAEENGACHVKVIDKESSKVYKSTIKTVRERGLLIDRSYGIQFALPIKYWYVDGEPRQLGLWGSELGFA